MNAVLSLLLFTSTLMMASCEKSTPTAPPQPAIKPNSAVVQGYIRNTAQERAIVFVHGVLGDATKTWTARNGAYFPALLLGDTAFDGLDIFVYDYPSTAFADSYSVDELADNLRLLLETAKVFETHREVLFVAHSMGGLVVRQLLLKYQRFAPKVSMVYFFATPTTGSELAALAKIAPSLNPQFTDMRPWKDQAYVGNLVRQWQAAEFRVKSYCAYEKRTTYGVRVVEEQSATNLCNQRLDPIDTDHLDIVKPIDRTAISYLALRQAVLSTPASPPAPPPAPPVLQPVYERRWMRTDEAGRPYFELFRARTENRHGRADIVVSRTESLAHPTGRVYAVEYTCIGYPCGWSYNPDGGYAAKYQIGGDGRSFTWYRKWDGDPADETYKALFEVQREVCTQNCPQQ